MVVRRVKNCHRVAGETDGTEMFCLICEFKAQTEKGKAKGPK